MNWMNALGCNHWGVLHSKKGKVTCSGDDPVSLHILKDVLGNWPTVNMQKHDFYAWVRFLDAVLQSLVLEAGAQALNCDQSLYNLKDAEALNKLQFNSLCTQVVEIFLMPSPSCLEATGAKSLPGQTVAGHAILLLCNLMSF